MKQRFFAIFIPCFLSIGALAADASFKISNFCWHMTKKDEVQIDSMKVQHGFSTFSMSSALLEPPAQDKIAVFGIGEGFSTSGLIFGLDTFTDLLSRIQINPGIRFGVIQIGPLSGELKTWVLENTVILAGLISAWKRACIITYNGNIYYLEQNFELLKEVFSDSLKM
jgi:hypothetical protein